MSVTVTNVVSTGLVAAYGFEEGSGTTTVDASGLGNTGTITAGTWTTAGRFGNALSFNGTSSLVTIADVAALRLSTTMTLEAWVRPTSSTSWRCAMLKESSGGLAYGLYSSDASSRPGGYVFVGSEVDATAPSAIALNAWTHLAATYDGATLRLFVNGTQVTSRALTGSIASSTQPLRIGGNQVWGEYFAGLIDEVRVYNRALSAAEIQIDMNTAVSVADTTPPVISSVSASVGGISTATVQWLTNEPATSVVRYGTAPGSLTQTASDALLLTAHAVPLSGLSAGTTYYYQATSADAAGNSASSTVGSFATTPDTTPPTVNLVAPLGGERLYTGSPYVIRWTATDNVGVTTIDVAFSGDGGATFSAIAGCSGLSGTAQSCTWAAPGPATTQGRIRVTARDAAGQSGTATSGTNFTVVSGTPTLTLTAPTTAVTWAIGSTQPITFDHNLGTGATVVIDLSRDGGATWSNLSPGLVTTSATTGSFGWVVSGPATTAARARVTWAGNPAVTSASAVSFTIADTTAPTVGITAPTAGSTVSGTVTVSATASDNVAVAGVQFLLDGVALGAEDTASPYSVAWNTTTATAGPHTLTARARDAAGNQTTSAAVSVTVTIVVSPGLVAAYGFEEGSGTTTVDASGLGNTGTITAGTWTTAGRFGNALSFNGTSSLVTIADVAALRLSTTMTLEAWVRPTSSTSWRCAMLKESSGGLAYGLYSSDASSRPGGYVRVGSEVDATAPSAIALNAWTHLAATYDGATLRLFVNGTQVTSRALTGSIVSSTQPLRIGGNQVWGEYFAGLIDEVRVYNRALSAAEIQTDMNTPVSP